LGTPSLSSFGSSSPPFLNLGIGHRFRAHVMLLSSGGQCVLLPTPLFPRRLGSTCPGVKQSFSPTLSLQQTRGFFRRQFTVHTPLHFSLFLSLNTSSLLLPIVTGTSLNRKEHTPKLRPSCSLLSALLFLRVLPVDVCLGLFVAFLSLWTPPLCRSASFLRPSFSRPLIGLAEKIRLRIFSS